MNNTANHKVIILEGCDRSGKDSMQIAIDKYTKYKHMCIDRGPVGFCAYKEIFNKSDEQASYEELINIEQGLKNIPHLMIYIHCDEKEIERRCDETNHEHYNVRYHQHVYEDWFNASCLNKVRVDSTNKHVDEIVQELITMGLL